MVDGGHFAYPYDKVFKFNCVGDVLVIIPGKHSSFNQAPVDEVGDDPDRIFTTESPEFITVSSR